MEGMAVLVILAYNAGTVLDTAQELEFACWITRS